MSLSERLLRYGLTTTRSDDRADEGATQPDSETGDTVDAHLLDASIEFVTSLNGRQVKGPDGTYWLVEREVSLDGAHGAFHLANLARIDLSALAVLTQQAALAELSPEEITFFDTETTGLAGGTGTSIFVAGVCRLERSSTSSAGYILRLRQYFLPDPSIELPFLSALFADLGSARAVVTYNGGRFDLPLLETRLLLHRRFTGWPFLHVDLLHPSRRLWRRAVDNCQLATLEREVLLASREDDLPGWEIPARYFLFLRQRRLEPLEPVFAHNASDVITLAALAARLGCVLRRDSPAPSSLLQASERLGLASLFETRRKWEQAAAAYEIVLTDGAFSDVPLALTAEALERLGAIYKRLREAAKARASWETILEATDGRSILAAVELAKYYEHRERDYSRALSYAEQALQTLLHWPGHDAEERAALIHRIARLRRRQQSARPPAELARVASSDSCGRD